jgi:DNA-binding PadR family transcriptional regulator
VYSVLDLYILAMLDRGLQTPYELQKDAALSLGATIPALRRLVKEKLVTRAAGLTSTKRPKHSYKVTKAGKQKVETGWEEYLKEGRAPTDLDALLRLIDVAQRYGAKRSKLVALLRCAAKRRFALASETLAASERIRPGPFAYPVTRTMVEVQRLQAEALVLGKIADVAERNSPGTGKRSDRIFPDGC